jgi:hypothetical protein
VIILQTIVLIKLTIRNCGVGLILFLQKKIINIKFLNIEMAIWGFVPNRILSNTFLIKEKK